MQTSASRITSSMRAIVLSVDRNILRTVLPSRNTQIFHLHEPSFRNSSISLPTCYVFPKYLNALQQPDFELELPKNILDPLCNDSSLIDVPESYDNFFEKQPSKEIGEPETNDSPVIQCKMHQGRNVKRLRRIRMRRHRYVKWLKRMRFKLRKQRFEREKKKAKTFQDQLDALSAEGEAFNAENFIKNEINAARKGGYSYNVKTELKRFLK